VRGKYKKAEAVRFPPLRECREGLSNFKATRYMSKIIPYNPNLKYKSRGCTIPSLEVRFTIK
jgi:hypothetical protein